MTKCKYFILILISWASFRADALSLDEFRSKMKAHIAKLPSKDSLGAQIEVLGQEKVLFSHNGESTLSPASSAKLITTMAALESLGPAFTFRTSIYKKGNDIVILGNGDPYLVSERLWLLARNLIRSGIKQIGSIKVNNGGTETYSGLMDWQDSGEPFTALVSGASFNFNSLEVHVRPNSASKVPNIELGPLPHHYAEIQNEVVQISGEGKKLHVESIKTLPGDRELFRVTGTIGKNAEPSIAYGVVSKPESYLAHVFAAMLRAEAITVEKDYSGIDADRTLGQGEPLAQLESLPLLDLIRLLNTYSNNFMTEQIFLATGRSLASGSASLAQSQEYSKKFLKKTKNCNSTIWENGSGLSWKSKVSARCFVDLLQDSFKDFRFFADILGSLPIGGATGSLKNRFRENSESFEPLRVRAKTGTIWSQGAVTSLVGFTRTADGVPIAFSLIQNDQRKNASLISGMKQWENKCMELMQKLDLAAK